MADFRVASEAALLSAIKRSKNDIALLIGSPLSAPPSPAEKGVPSVNDVLRIIEDHLDSDPELLAEYKKEIISKYSNDNELYQKSFEFLADYTDPETPNIIIRKAVLCSSHADKNNIDVSDLAQLISLQNDTNAWHLPPATEALASLLKNHPRFKGPVLTTNFDPLLSIALEKINYEPNRTVLHGDGSLEQLQSTRINIVHMHGFWVSTDTMHTQSQLKLKRPKLKSSLSRVLKNKTLLVLGYGGWDDIFMQTLRDLMDDESANLDVIWAFYESDENIIRERYDALLNTVQPALGRSRFRIYGGINCHDFLPKLNSENSVSIDDKSKVQDEKATSNRTSTQEESIAFTKEENCTPTWNIHADPAHKYIREVERVDIIEALGSSYIVNLVSDWGLGKDEFISTLINDENSPFHNASLYYVDLSGVRSRDDLLEKIESDYGFGLQDFISGMSFGRGLLCLDSYDSNLARQEDNELWSVTSWFANLVAEYNSDCKVIVCSKSSLKHNLPHISLSKLEEFDIRSYITHHSIIQEKPDEHLVESLTELSRGIPSFLDKYIHELELLSIDDIYDSHFSPEAYRHDQDSTYPSELKKRVNDIANSSEEHSRRSYELLKTLSILEHGDSFTNLKKSNSNFNFRTSHLKELYSLELLEPLNISKSFLKTSHTLGDEKLHCLPPIVRDYVYSQLTTKEIYAIVKQLADVHLGKNWRSGSLNLCKVTEDLLRENSKSIGSTHIIIIHLLRCPIELNSSRGIDSALRICEAYCMYLSNKNRHKESAKFIEKIKAVVRESDKASYSLQVDIYEGEALRMLGKREKAEVALLSAYEQLKEKSNPEKRMLKKVLSSLAYFYEQKNDFEKANEMANELLEIDSNHVGARYIVAISSDHTSINELKQLEQHFRNNDDTIAANNTVLSIVDLENSNQIKLKWLDKILNGKEDQYNKFRAITTKGTLLIESNEELRFDTLEMMLLHTSYTYSFSQKMTSIFNSSHKVLWEYYSQTNNYLVLFKLFRQSSLFWRIYGNSNQEQIYSLKMMKMINNLLPESVDLSKHRYVTLRVRQLSNEGG